jgi:hypothetical protein
VGNGYRFQAGHTVKLELLGQDSPYLRPSNGSFTVTVSALSAELPALETPGSGQVVKPVRSGGAVDGKTLRVSITPKRVRAGKKVTFILAVFGADCRKCSPYPLAGARVRFAGRIWKIGSGGQKVVKRRFGKAGVVKARARFKGYPTKTTKVRVLRRR